MNILNFTGAKKKKTTSNENFRRKSHFLVKTFVHSKALTSNKVDMTSF